MKKKTNVVAIIPAFNEEKRINTVIHSIQPYVNTIIVIDDGSTDNTIDIIDKHQTIILRHLCNLGQGAALQTGFEYAKTLKPDAVITFDADGQFLGEDIPVVLEPILKGKADIVLGSRFLGSTSHMPFIKYILLQFGIVFTYIFSNIKLTDTHNGFRALNRKALDTIRITQNGMAHASEIIDQIKLHNLRYIEAPVTVRYDKYSKQKGQRYSNTFNIIFNLIFKKLS